MINFHLGAPGIFADLHIILAEVAGSRVASDRYTRARQIFESRVRPYLNCRSKDPSPLDVLREEAFAAIEAVSQDMPIVISQPELFGTTADLMRPGRALPAIERRFGRLCEVFEGMAWTVHLVITNQIDAIWQVEGVAPERKLQAIRETGLSWSNLVWRLRRVGRDCHLIVWDFERPDVIAPFLIESLMLVGRGELDGSIYRRITECHSKPKLDLIGFCSADDVSSIERLDELYDTDLEKIASMKGVTLMRVEE
ncbi:MAG: hypothetical protein ACK47C_05955 [Paracoccaceae bacterium]